MARHQERFASTLLLILAASSLNHTSARADEIILRGGGQVQGKVSPDPRDPERVQIWLLNGKNPLSFQKKQVLQVIPRPSPLDEYMARRAKAPSDAPAQFDLGQWCEQNKLSGLAFAHYEAAVAQDRAFEPAHQKLGHVLHDGRWLTHDELRAVQGLVKHKGRWITPEEKSLFESNVKLAGEQAAMLRQFRLLRQTLIDGTDERRREAEAQLMQIRDPSAIVPLIRVFGNDPPGRRNLLIHVLGKIPGREAASALVGRLLIEADVDVRHGALEQLQERKERDIELRLTRALHASNIAIINRAAWAIGHLGIASAVPRLVPALISTEERTVWTNPDGGLLGVDGPAIGASVAPSTPYYGYPPGALLADNGSSFAVLTPSAVGPGVVAYGAYSVPYGAGFGGAAALAAGSPMIPDVGIAGVNPNVPPTSPNRGPVLRTVLYPIQNIEVHDALVSLTGKDFEYNIPAWKNWVSKEFNPQPDPVRRVPQP